MHDAVWKALADPTRRQLLDMLKVEPRTSGDLCVALDALDRCTVLKHLDVLVRAGLVVIERRGRHRINHINVAPLHSVVERWVSGHTARLAQAAFKLKSMVEETDDEHRNP